MVFISDDSGKIKGPQQQAVDSVLKIQTKACSRVYLCMI